MENRRNFLGTLAAIPFAGPVVSAASAEPIQRARAERTPTDPSTDAAFFTAFRKEFVFPPHITYCNTGTLGPMTHEILRALTEGYRQVEATLPEWPYFQADGEPLTGYQPLLAIRTTASELLGCAPDEVAITQNATMGMNDLGNGIEWQPGDEVLTTDQEHGGAVSIFRLMAKRRGIVVKELPLSTATSAGPDAIVAMFRKALTPRTRAIMVSHITSQLGIRMPVEELIALAKGARALSIIDGAQAFGQIRVNVRELDCDAYVASPHKWLMAPKGTGLLYIRKSVQDSIWTTLASYQWENKEQGSFRFMQYGTGSTAIIAGLAAAFSVNDRIGMDRIERWDRMLALRLRDGLAAIPGAVLSSPSDKRLASAITTFRVEKATARELQDALWAQNIRVRAQGDDKGVRLSAHICVSPADIDRVLRVVAMLAEAKAKA